MIPARFDLEKKVILLTGGAGLYGRGLTSDLASTGATLIIASRNLEACELVAQEEQKQGHHVVAYQYDQGDEKSIEELSTFPQLRVPLRAKTPPSSRYSAIHGKPSCVLYRTRVLRLR